MWQTRARSGHYALWRETYGPVTQEMGGEDPHGAVAAGITRKAQASVSYHVAERGMQVARPALRCVIQ